MILGLEGLKELLGHSWVSVCCGSARDVFHSSPEAAGSIGVSCDSFGTGLLTLRLDADRLVISRV